MRRLCVTLVCLLAPLALLSACGGGHSKTGPTSGLSIKQIKRLNKINSAKSVAECEQTANNPGLPANQKPLVETECQDIRTGDNVGLETVDRKICDVQAAALPEPQRTSMEAQCKNLGPAAVALPTATGTTPATGTTGTTTTP